MQQATINDLGPDHPLRKLVITLDEAIRPYGHDLQLSALLSVYHHVAQQNPCCDAAVVDALTQVSARFVERLRARLEVADRLQAIAAGVVQQTEQLDARLCAVAPAAQPAEPPAAPAAPSTPTAGDPT